MNFNKILFFCLFLMSTPCVGQQLDSLRETSFLDSAIESPFKKRLLLMTSLQGVAYGTSMIALNKIWYDGFPKSKFHYYNDAGEWLDMDKVGHGYTAYHLTRMSYRTWKWTGLSDKKAILIAGVTGLGYQTVIETLDGYSSGWGWSWSDMKSNTAGIGLWMSQELLWKKQRIRLKFSAHYNKYNDPILEKRTNEFFGSVFSERLLKDYNAQTYWLSANLHDFNKQLPVPQWLNIAIGYGADNMFGGYGNNWPGPNGSINRDDIKRFPQWYVSLDVDFEKVKTRKKWVKSLLFVLNTIKIPAPTLIYANNKWSSQWFYY